MCRLRLSFYTFLAIILFFGCNTPKAVYYSYKVNTYAVDSSKHFLFTESLMSFGDYLFEFRVAIRQNTDIFLNSGISKSYISSYDTTSVYLLQNKNVLYYEIDTFAIKNKVIKTGKLWEKLYGQHFDSLDLVSPKPSPYLIPIDTVINHIPCYYVNLHEVDKVILKNAEAEVKLILLKKPKFNSLNKMNGGVFPDKDYCVVGINAYSYKTNDGFVQELDSLRPLTKKEIGICESMIAKSKIAVVDTIKGYPFIKKYP